MFQQPAGVTLAAGQDMRQRACYDVETPGSRTVRRRRSRNVQPPRAADLVDPHQVIEDLLGGSLSVVPLTQHSRDVGKRDDRQAVRLILAADHHLKRVRAIGIPIPCDQDKRLLLTSCPDEPIGRVEWETERLEVVERKVQSEPQLAPGR